MCERQRTCRAEPSAARRVAQSPGCGPPAGGQPGRSPPGHTLRFGPAAPLPPAACQRWCRCSEVQTEDVISNTLGLHPLTKGFKFLL